MSESSRLEFLDDTLKEIGTNVVSFYHGVIADDKCTSEDQETKRALKQLRKTYVRKLRADDPAAISFESSATRRAYVYQYCPAFTGAVASGFAEFLRGAPNYVGELCSKDSMTVCCLGGGPATELVAIYFVLKDVLLNNPLTNGVPLKLSVVIVDSERGWAQTAARVISKLQEDADASAVKVRFEFSFVVHDVTSPMTQEVMQALERSDVVTMVKFLSANHGPRDEGVRSTIVRGICDHLPLRSILLSVDSSGWKPVDEVGVAIESCENMTRLYGIKKASYYRLSKASKSLCFQLYARRYGQKYCTVTSLNKVGVWRKMTAEENDDVIGKLNDLVL